MSGIITDKCSRSKWSTAPFLDKTSAMVSSLSFCPPVIAHRGGGVHAPENTLAAIGLAHEQGVGWVEVDVKLTLDGIPILMHDDTLDRTTDATGFVADAPWKLVQQLDGGSWFDSHFAGERVPRLTDALQRVLEYGMNAFVELKPCPRRAQATTMVTLIEMSRIWPEGDKFPVISSFDLDSLVVARQLLPHWPRALFLDEWREDWKALLDKTQSGLITLRDDLLTRERVEIIMEKKKTLLAYTIDDPVRARELLAWGVSAVFSDNPRKIIENI